jgi:hypothetical protein
MAMQEMQSSTRQNRNRRKRKAAMLEKFKADGQVIDDRNRDLRRLRQHLLSKGAASSSQPVTAAQHGAAAEENQEEFASPNPSPRASDSPGQDHTTGGQELGSPDPAPRLWRHLRDIRDRQLLPDLLPIEGDARTLAISEESAVRRRAMRDRQLLPDLLPIAGDARTLAISEESAVRRRAMRAMAAAHAAPHSTRTLHVDGIGPIAQYHHYVDCAEEKGLHLFSRDYRQQCLNSKLSYSK